MRALTQSLCQLGPAAAQPESIDSDVPVLLQAVLGKARALEAIHEVRAAWEVLSEASIRLPWAVPVHMELARLTLAQQDWDGLVEVTARLQEVDGSSIMAMAYLGELSRFACSMTYADNVCQMIACCW